VLLLQLNYKLGKEVYSAGIFMKFWDNNKVKMAKKITYTIYTCSHWIRVWYGFVFRTQMDKNKNAISPRFSLKHRIHRSFQKTCEELCPTRDVYKKGQPLIVVMIYVWNADEQLTQIMTQGKHYNAADA